MMAAPKKTARKRAASRRKAPPKKLTAAQRRAAEKAKVEVAPQVPFVIVPVAVIDNITNTLGTLALQLGGVVTGLQQSIRPLGVPHKDPTGGESDD